jgi:predicted  nucleic acid-binding Zn-ribbon protein
MVAESLFSPETPMITGDEIIPLIALQKAQTAFEQISEHLAEIPQELGRLDNQLAEVKERNDQIHRNVEQAKKRCRETERNLSDLQQALEKYNKQIYDVKSNKEYSAIIAEIANIKVRISDAETEILVAMDELETLTAEVSIADDILGKEEAAITEQKAILNHERNKLEEELQRATSNLDNACQAVPASVKSEYDRIQKYTGSTVVAPATKRGDNYACGGCFMKITPHIVTELRKGNIFQCEACARLIYWCDDE